MTRVRKSGEKLRKYAILEKLNQLPHQEFQIAKNKLPIALKVSKRTFQRWMYLEYGDTLEVPCDKMAAIAKFLGVTIETMHNQIIPQYNIAQLKRLETSNLAKELNLTL